jgi:hypothetical protein
MIFVVATAGLGCASLGCFLRVTVANAVGIEVGGSAKAIVARSETPYTACAGL